MADREHDTSIDQVLDAMTRARGPDGQPREPVTYDEFQKVLDTTPLFMRETPKETGGDYVLEALKSLVFEGEGDGESHASAAGPRCRKRGWPERDELERRWSERRRARSSRPRLCAPPQSLLVLGPH